ncbi:2-oxoacid:acceptor oxidoreductase family protein [Candidatus Woesearchaeota archaeon]|nr:2-oxoacid:acceptor oxidoreductase family protein [Candidatus Woesearchaeota archaeon]MBW3022362.1 2-oxoacid:acceptor oxidoreductase family protein [Candidatus Woesearchaeota archaeon]
MIKKIIMVGEGGQGVKLLANALANILTTLDKNVTLTYSYDAAVRGGNITANLIFSDEKIDNPIIDTADILLMLSEVPGFSAKKMIVEKSLLREGDENQTFDAEEVTEMPLLTIASERFGSPIFINMIALGHLLKKMDIDITQINLEKYLPERFIEKNVEAIRYGYSWKE